MTDSTENKLFPGRPDYTGPTEGYFAFLHHDVLFEKSHNVAERVAYVKAEKPERKRKIRLHNMLYLPFMTSPLLADYEAKRALLWAGILGFIKKHIPDCPWNGKKLVF